MPNLIEKITQHFRPKPEKTHSPETRGFTPTELNLTVGSRCFIVPPRDDDFQNTLEAQKLLARLTGIPDIANQFEGALVECVEIEAGWYHMAPVIDGVPRDAVTQLFSPKTKGLLPWPKPQNQE